MEIWNGSILFFLLSVITNSPKKLAKIYAEFFMKKNVLYLGRFGFIPKFMHSKEHAVLTHF